LAKRDEVRAQITKGVDLTAPPKTLRQWLTEWLTTVKSSDGTGPATIARYDQIARVHLIPQLGTVKLAALTPRHVQSLLLKLQGVAAPATIVKVHGVLRNALADAERMDLVSRNVAKAVRPPRLSRTERRSLTPAEAGSLLSHLKGDRLESVFIVALSTGLRRGEVLGLRWQDVDLEGRVLFVRQALQRVDRALKMVPPKTHRSSRPIPLPQFAVTAFSQQKVRQANDRRLVGRAWEDGGLVFTTEIGTPLEPRNVNRRFYAARSAAGLEWVRLHDLRHAFATFLLDQGEGLRTVMDLLGHSTIRLTADTYGHVLPSRARKAADVIDKVLGNT
jgi:integrase